MGMERAMDLIPGEWIYWRGRPYKLTAMGRKTDSIYGPYYSLLLVKPSTGEKLRINCDYNDYFEVKES